MIFVTGDMHADPGRFSMENFPEQKEMTRNDYMVICGDFGLLWDKEESKRGKWWLDWLAEKSYTTLVVDGNHEDFTRLNTLPEEEWNGGRVHKVRENVIHLMRGEIFDLNGKAAYIFGGARSHDVNGIADKSALEKDYTFAILQPDDPLLQTKLQLLDRYGASTRIEGVNWWRAEMPTEDEMQRGLQNLRKHGKQVDFIFSHDGPASDVAIFGGGTLTIDPLNQYLEKVKQETAYKKWFFGHHHRNMQLTDKDTVIYENIERIC